MWKQLKIFWLKDLKTYFEWKFRGFGIFRGCSESLSIVFSPLLKQVCLILFSVILFISVCWDLNEEKGRREGKLWSIPFSFFLWCDASWQRCSELWGWHPLWPSAKLQKSKSLCRQLLPPPLCPCDIWECGWAKHRLVQVLKDEDKVI